MFERILKVMREKARAKEYVVTFHGRQEMLDDELSIDDVELTILSGKIVERQKDRVTAEWKYRLQGEATGGRPVEVVAKLSPSGKLVVITIYEL